MVRHQIGYPLTLEFLKVLFLARIYFWSNDLTDNISCIIKSFADDASLFLRVVDVGMCHQTIKKDLNTITQCAFQWNMKFNTDISKQVIEVIFYQKRKLPFHPHSYLMVYLLKETWILNTLV